MSVRSNNFSQWIKKTTTKKQQKTTKQRLSSGESWMVPQIMKDPVASLHSEDVCHLIGVFDCGSVINSGQSLGE